MLVLVSLCPCNRIAMHVATRYYILFGLLILFSINILKIDKWSRLYIHLEILENKLNEMGFKLDCIIMQQICPTN